MYTVSQVDRDDAIAAVVANRIHQPGTLQWVTSAKTADSLVILPIFLVTRSHCRQEDPLDDSPLPNCPVRGIAFTESDKQVLADLRGASTVSTPRCTVSRYQSWAVLCRYRSRWLLAEVPKGSDRNAELKHRLQLWEVGDIKELVGRKLGQQHSGRTASQERASGAATN